MFFRRLPISSMLLAVAVATGDIFTGPSFSAIRGNIVSACLSEKLSGITVENINNGGYRNFLLYHAHAIRIKMKVY